MKCKTLKDTKRLARTFVKALKRRKSAVVLFDASMGAGKTTFVREVVKGLGIRVPATSPTFSIINKYSKNVYHVDLYRIENVDELKNTDFYEIISGENFVFIEWTEKFEIEYPKDAIWIKIEMGEDQVRVFNIIA